MRSDFEDAAAEIIPLFRALGAGAADRSPGLLAASNRDVWTMVRDALPS